MDENPPILSPWDLLPLAGLGAAWLWFQHWLPLLPQRVPAHWNAAGQINGWMDKDSLFSFVLIFTVGIWLLHFVIGLFLRTGDERRVATAWGLLPFRAFLALGFALMLSYAMPMAVTDGQQAFFVGMGFMVVCLIAGFVFLLRAIRSGPLPEGSRAEDYRLGGTVYSSERDARLWVPRRSGLGWTLNFAHPMAWPMMFLLLLPVIAVIFFRTAMSK